MEMETEVGQGQPDIRKILLSILLVACALVLPSLHWSLFSWMYLALPLLAFLIVGRFGAHVGTKMLLTAAVVALAVHLVAGSFRLFLFASVMLLPGYVLCRTALQGASPAKSGFWACLALAGGWMIASLAAMTSGEASMYRQLLGGLDQALIEALAQYQKSEEIDASTLVVVESTITQMRTIIPAVLPGVLGGLILVIVWTTMAFGKIIGERVAELSPWQDFSLWALPEKLIWLVIVAGLLVMAPWQPLPKIGINALLLLTIVYCFQGMSVTVFFMQKWKVPLLLRSFIYVMIIFQSLGTLALLFLGIADIWMDFRQRKPRSTPPTP